MKSESFLTLHRLWGTRIPLVHKENKNNDFIQQFLLFRVSLQRVFTTVSWLTQKKLLNKVFIFVFFAHIKYSRSFIKLRLNHWCHIRHQTILTMSFLPVWALNVLVVLLSIEGQKAFGFHQKYLNLCSEDEQRSYGFGTRWGWVIYDKIFIFGWTIPLTRYFMKVIR